MIGDTFVINAVAHAYNLADDNAIGDTGRMVRDAFYGIHTRYNPVGARLPRTAFCTDQSVELLARTHFAESPVDLLVYHTLRLDSLFADGLCSLRKAIELTERWPGRVVTYLGIDPTLGLDVALTDLAEQHAALPAAVGVKLYPDQLAPYRTFRMDDPELMFPLYRRIAELGLRVVAVHKALPNGPVPLAPYRVDDVEGAAMRFPELNFEIVHAGMAFTTETALAVARFPNVYANLEVTTLLLAVAPRLFAETLAEFLYWAGPGKLLYSDGALFAHPAHIAERFAAFTLPEDLLAKYGIEQLTAADRAAILSGNYAVMAGLDLAGLARRQAEDEWSSRRRRHGLDPPFTAWRELAGAAPDAGTFGV
ncbi:MAG: amidohydrolase family protein [Actinobacteria bacterium]|nr:amidohydrolase family protein [Actinomycetota bacterium]